MQFSILTLFNICNPLKIKYVDYVKKNIIFAGRLNERWKKELSAAE